MNLRAGLVLLVSVLIAAEAKDDATKKDMEKIQGTWVAVAGELDGSVLEKKVFQNTRFSFMGDKVIIVLFGKKKLEGTFRLDATKEPKTINLKTKGAGFGIYQFQGDQLEICLTVYADNEKRPKKFKTTDGSGASMLTFKREKK